MKNRMKFLWPLVFSFLLFIFVIFFSVCFFTIDTKIHTNYEYFSFLGAILSGFLGPVISIFGFWYLYATFKENGVQKEIELHIDILSKYENCIDQILGMNIYNIFDGKKPHSSSMKRNLSLNNKDNVPIHFYYDMETKSKTNLLQEVLQIKRNLFFIIQSVDKILKLDPNHEICNYYRLKYSLLQHKFTNKKYYLTDEYQKYKYDCNITKELSTIDDACEKFYSKNQFLIENDPD